MPAGPSTVRARLLDATVEVEIDDPAVHAALADAWVDVLDPAQPPGAPLLRIEVRGSGPYVANAAGPSPTARELPTVARVVDWIATRTNRAVLHASDLVCIHCGAVEIEGAVVLLPAVSGSGKTTLTAGLVRAGAGYLSDEAVGLHANGSIRPYRKPLAVKGPPDAEGEERVTRHVAASSLAPAAPHHAPDPDEVGPPRLLVFPRYEAGATTAIEPIGRAEALVELAHHTIAFADRPERSIDVLARAVAHAACYRLRSGDLDEAVAAVYEAVDDARATSPTAPLIEPPADADLLDGPEPLEPHPSAGSGSAHPPPRWRRAGAVRTVVLDGEGVLLDLRAGRLHRLNRAGTDVWRALPEHGGGPADAQLLEQLAAEGLVEPAP